MDRRRRPATRAPRWQRASGHSQPKDSTAEPKAPARSHGLDGNDDENENDNVDGRSKARRRARSGGESVSTASSSLGADVGKMRSEGPADFCCTPESHPGCINVPLWTVSVHGQTQQPLRSRDRHLLEQLPAQVRDDVLRLREELDPVDLERVPFGRMSSIRIAIVELMTCMVGRVGENVRQWLKQDRPFRRTARRRPRNLSTVPAESQLLLLERVNDNVAAHGLQVVLVRQETESPGSHVLNYYLEVCVCCARGGRRALQGMASGDDEAVGVDYGSGSGRDGGGVDVVHGVQGDVDEGPTPHRRHENHRRQHNESVEDRVVMRRTLLKRTGVSSSALSAVSTASSATSLSSSSMAGPHQQSAPRFWQTPGSSDSANSSASQSAASTPAATPHPNAGAADTSNRTGASLPLGVDKVSEGAIGTPPPPPQAVTRVDRELTMGDFVGRKSSWSRFRPYQRSWSVRNILGSRRSLPLSSSRSIRSHDDSMADDVATTSDLAMV